MLLNVTKIVAPDGEIHLAWAHQRETLCEVKKTHWPWPNPYSLDPTCKFCRALYMEAASIEAQADLGFPEIDRLASA